MTDYFATESAYTAETAAEVLRLIRMGVVPAQFSDALGLDISAPDRWAHENEGFAALYAEAKLVGADAMMSYCIAIADKTDVALKADQRKLMIEARKQCAALWNPDKYGPKVEKAPGPTINLHAPMPSTEEGYKDMLKKFGLSNV